MSRTPLARDTPVLTEALLRCVRAPGKLDPCALYHGHARALLLSVRLTSGGGVWWGQERQRALLPVDLGAHLDAGSGHGGQPHRAHGY